MQEKLAEKHTAPPGSEVFDGLTLPPKELRPCGSNFQDDGFYLASAKNEANKLVKYLGLSPRSSLLDVGSGPGRLAIGILQTVGDIHMLTEGVRAYLEEFRRMLRPEGRIFLTAFLEEDEGVPDVSENPEGYLGREWKGPLHCVRYNRKFFETLLDENGFRLDWFDPDREKLKGPHQERGQRGLFISKKAGNPLSLT